MVALSYLRGGINIPESLIYDHQIMDTHPRSTAARSFHPPLCFETFEVEEFCLEQQC